MKIYLNNFRGFTTTFIDLKDVNFLVGENSTGKTSVLKVLKLLHSGDFWIINEMSLEGSGLGYFNEITNDNQENNSYFEIGYFDTHSKSGVKLKYISVDERPTISEISVLTNDLEAVFRKSGKGVTYRYEIKKDANNISLDKYFEEWVSKSVASTKPFEEFKRDEHELGKFPFYIELSLKVLELYQKNDLGLMRLQAPKLNYVSFAPIRSNPKRVYGDNDFKHSTDGAHTPYLLKDNLGETGNSQKKERKKTIERILNKFGSDSGLFESVNIKKYGNNASSPFELQITIGGRNMNFTNVGYGVSQILPLLAEVIIHPKGTLFAIQQPEVHLHPRGQAAFGDFIFKSKIEENKKFIVETHSDYLIDRFRIRLSKSDQNKNPTSQILFFTKDRRGNQVERIEIFQDGDIQESQPKGYRDFFIREQLDLLNI